MVTTLKHEYANVTVETLPSGQNKIDVTLLNKDRFMPIGTCVTSYPIDLINQIMNVAGPDFLCDEILRDESPDYVQKSLTYDLLGYQTENMFKNKRLLDFGSGSGASTMILTRMLPQTEIVGIELEEKLLSIARLRAKYYGHQKIKFLLSPGPDKLPPDIGQFDYIVFSAVYEHLLWKERKELMPKIWNLLKSGGILFLNQTPYRYFPVETHTTQGLPLINYLPERAAFFLARHLSRSKLKKCTRHELLRRGIRGGSPKEILKILLQSPYQPVLLNPTGYQSKDRVDLWYAQTDKSRRIVVKKLFRFSIKIFKALTGITMLPYLALAIKKSEGAFKDK